MNRRGFIALATAAAVVPQELIAAPEPAPVLSEASLESLMIEIFENVNKVSIVPTKFIVRAEFVKQLQEMLNEEFSGAYECIPYESIFKDEETLAGEVGSGDSPVLPWGEEAEGAPEGVALECRGVSRLYNPVGAFEGSEENLRKRE